MKFKDKLIKLGACIDAIEWVGNMTLKEAWKTCPRGDWMIWYYAKTHPKNLRKLTLAKALCANTVRHLMQDERSKKAVDTAILFGQGKATREELDAANSAAATVAINSNTAATLSTVTNAIIYVFYTNNATIIKKQKQTADICRKILKV